MWRRLEDVRRPERLRPAFNKLPVVLLLATLALFAYLLRGILTPFVLAAVIAYVTAPAVNWLDARLPVGRRVVIILAFLILMMVLAAIGLLVGAAVIHDLPRLSRTLGRDAVLLPERLGDTQLHLFGYQIAIGTIAADLIQDLRRWLNQSAWPLDAMRWGVQVLFNGVLTVVLLFYFMLSGERLAHGALWLVPPPYRPLCHTFMSHFNPVLRRYLLGVAAIVLYTMTVAWVIVGQVLAVPYPMLLALLTGLLEPIPFFGPVLALVIVGGVTLEYGSALTVGTFVVCAIALRLSIDQIVGPLVLGRAVELSPSVIILVLLIGWMLFGFIGMFLAVPVAAAVRIVLGILYEEQVS